MPVMDFLAGHLIKIKYGGLLTGNVLAASSETLVSTIHHQLAIRDLFHLFESLLWSFSYDWSNVSKLLLRCEFKTSSQLIIYVK